MSKIYRYSIIGIILLALLSVLAWRFFQNNAPAPVGATTTLRTVSLASVGALSGELSPLPLVGVVESKTEAVLKSESQGQVTRVPYSLGDSVVAGSVIAELENSRERARVSQTQAGLASARAFLSKIESGARTEDVAITEARVLQAKTALAEAIASAREAIATAYANADDATRGKADQLFSNGRTDNPSLLFFDSNREEIEWQRFLSETALTDWYASISSDVPIDEALDDATEGLTQVRDFLTKLSLAVNGVQSSSDLSQAKIDGWRATVSAARTAVGTSLASISSIRENISARESAVVIAEQELGRITSGERSEDVLSAEAQVNHAEAGLAEALASLEKTIVRTPISGTINALPIDRGDFVGAFQTVAVVSNNGALQITTHITESDRSAIAVGNEVTIENVHAGVITRIAPALDPATKKIEVTIGITSDDAPFVTGESVRISIARKRTETDTTIAIPLSALKVTPDATIVFTVSKDGMLSAHAVVLGPLLGDRVIVREGLSSEMVIVSDARGLKDGESVRVAE